MDIELYFEKYGHGAPLILLHGNGDSHAFFAGQIPTLAKRFTVYAVDTRGHGQSPMGSKPFTLTQFADDLLGFMNGHGIERAHIVGASDGANIAMLFALRCQQRICSLVLNSGNLVPESLAPGFLSDIQRRYAEIADSDDPGARYETALLRLMIEELHIPSEALLGFMHYNPEVIDADRRGLSPYDVSSRMVEEIRRIKARMDQN